MKAPIALPSLASLRRAGFVLWPAFALALFCSCHREEKVVEVPAVDPTATELADVRRKLAVSQSTLAATLEDQAAAAAALRAANHESAEKEQVLTQRELQLKKASEELDAVKKSEAWIFAEISKQQQQGQNVIALARYQKFIKDFPHSPLASHANRALGDLTEETARDTQLIEERMEPKRQEFVMKRFLDDGLLTLQELAPMLKSRTRPQVQALLGKPNRIFPDGTEIGYVDRVTAPTGTRKGMLIISFEGSVVSALRMDYAGPKITP